MKDSANRAAAPTLPESGSTMIVALLVLFLLTSVAISYVAITKNGKQAAGDQELASRAFQEAEAGIGEALLRMSSSGSADYIGQPAGKCEPGWGIYIVNDPGAGALDPSYGATSHDGRDNDRDGLVDEPNEHYPETSSRLYHRPESEHADYPWVLVRYKLDSAGVVVLFGDHDGDPSTPPIENTLRGTPKIIVTAQGHRGLGSKIVTVEAVKWPLPPVPGAVYFEGALAFRGAAFALDGRDHLDAAPYAVVEGSAPIAGLSTPNDVRAAIASLTARQSSRVRGAGGTPSVRPSRVNLDLPALAATWSQLADVSLAGPQINPDPSGWGKQGDFKIVYVAGDLRLSRDAAGAGVLIVDGDLDVGGPFHWDGLVLCLGDAKIAGGGHSPCIVGGLLVQGTLTGASAIGGTASILYSSAMIHRLSALTSYQVSSWMDP